MTMKRVLYISLFLILLCAGFLRFYKLNSNPPSLTWDEAAWGYNAYTLGSDGRDEFGRFLPVDYLESFGDFKPPMYAYLDIIPVKLFGLNEFATRFPSAFFGVLTVLMTYVLTLEIFSLSKNKQWYALTAAFVLAISPWHILLSRAAFEANIATFFLVLGVWLFLKAIHSNGWFLPFSFVSFVLSLYTFNSARIVAPLLLLMLCLTSWRKIGALRKQTIVAFVIALVVFMPLSRFLFTPQARLRFNEVNIFSDSQIVKTSNQEISNDANSLVSKVIHNRRILYGLSFLRHYFDNLSPEFLFIKGDGNPKFSTQDVGELYLWDLIFFISGIFFLFRKKEGSWYIIPLWLILGIIPAATARETPHALRIEATLPSFQLLIAYGIYNVYEYIKVSYRRFPANLVVSIASIGLLLNVIYFLHGYFFQYPREYSGEWQYGYKEAIAYTQSVASQYNHIIMTETLGRPYMYVAFYTKINPEIFRKTIVVHRDSFGFVDVTGLGKYAFSVNASAGIQKDKTLVIDTPAALSSHSTSKKTFYLLNGDPILEAVSK